MGRSTLEGLTTIDYYLFPPISLLSISVTVEREYFLLFFSQPSRNGNGQKKKKTKKEKIEEKNKRKINLTIRRFCNSHVTSTLD